MSIIIPKHASNVNSDGPSPIIWADCPVVTYLKDPGKGLHFFEDFLGNFTADDVMASPYFLLAGTNPDMAVVTDEVGGVIELEGSGGGVDEEAYICSNILYELKMQNGKRFWLEAKMKLQVANDDCCLLFGLAESAMFAADACANDSSGSSTLLDYDFVGFHAGSDGTNMDDIDFVYHEDGDGGTVTRVAEVIDNADLTSDEYFRLGLTYDGKNTITAYANGVKIGTTLDPDDFATGTANQLTDKLGIILGYKNLENSQTFLAVDWVRFACEK